MRRVILSMFALLALSGAVPHTRGNGTYFQEVGLSAPFTVPVGVTVGQVVRITTADNADAADATSSATVPVFGVVIFKPTTTTAMVAVAGEAPVFVGLTPGATYYLATTPGAITATPPATLGNVVQKVGIARNATTLVLTIEQAYTIL